MAASLCAPADRGVPCSCSSNGRVREERNAVSIYRRDRRRCPLAQWQIVNLGSWWSISGSRIPGFRRGNNKTRVNRRSNERIVISQMNKSNESLYHVLGVSASATDKELKQAYRRLALKYHPDVNKEPGALDNFLCIKQAYQTLIDPKSRSKYDASKEASESRNKYDWYFQGGYKKRHDKEEFYGLEEFFRDLQADWEEKGFAASSQANSKTLWEELAEIGEEFVEFLEKELKVEPDNMQSSASDMELNNNLGNQSATNAKSSKQETKATIEAEVNEIEEILLQLKKEMGL